MTRWYNSQSNYNGEMGYGWSWKYGWHLDVTNIQIRRGDGKLISFIPDPRIGANGRYIRQYERKDEYLEPMLDGSWLFHQHNGSLAEFDSFGKLKALVSESGMRTSLFYYETIPGGIPFYPNWRMHAIPNKVLNHYGQVFEVIQGMSKQYDAATASFLMIGELIGGYIPNRRSPQLFEYSNLITELKDSTGRSWKYQYDINDNLTSTTYPDNTVKRYQYNDPNDIHNLTAIIDENGQTFASYRYDAQDRAIHSEHLQGQKFHDVDYSQMAQNMVTVTDSKGQAVQYTREVVNGIPMITSSTSSTCNCGSAQSFAMDIYSGLMSASTAFDGSLSQYTYDPYGRLASETEAVGTALERVTSYTYDVYGHVQTMTNAQGATTFYAYNAVGEKTLQTDAYGTNLAQTTQWIWNTDHTLQQRIAPNALVTSYQYDVHGQLAATVLPNTGNVSNIIKVQYDALGRLISESPLNMPNAKTIYQYDLRDNLSSMRLADGSGFDLSYDAAGMPVTRTLKNTTLTETNTFNSDGQLSTRTLSDGSQWTYTYDALGLLQDEIILNNAGVEVYRQSYQYDAKGRMTRLTYADQSVERYTYDTVGRLQSQIDALGQETTYTYDGLGRLTSNTDVTSGEVSRYWYTSMNQVLKVKAANNVITSYTYDLLGRVKRENSADSGMLTYSYIKNSHNLLMISHKFNGTNTKKVSYRYDALNRVILKKYPQQPSLNESYKYKQKANSSQIITKDSTGKSVHLYNTSSKLLIKQWVSTAGFTSTLQYAYDAAGRKKWLKYPDGQKLMYSYNKTSGYLSKIKVAGVGGQTLVSALKFNPLGLSNQRLGNGIVEKRFYDTRGRLSQWKVQGLENRRLTWDNTSNITAIDHLHFPVHSQSFSYDSQSRLTSATGSYGVKNYQYDANANRTALNQTLYDYELSPKKSNKLITESTPTTSINSTYSPEGLLMQWGNVSFNYHANNRLANVDNAGTVLADYSYNAAGERVTKVINGISTDFFYDEQGQLIGEYDATGNMLAQYVYAPSGRLATLKANGNILFHHNDHLGTPQAMTDSNKRVVWQASYTPFGIAIIDEDPDLDGISETNNFRFPGQYHDAETGLSYNYFRYYDPETGRYITSDPIGLKGGLNTFAYVGGNPIGAVDFFGLICVTCVANNSGGSGYIDGVKQCVYNCVNESGESQEIKASGKDLEAGDVCFGADYSVKYQTSGDFTNVTNKLNPFKVDTEKLMDKYWTYPSDMIDAIDNAFKLNK